MKVGTLWAGIGMMCIFGLGLLLIQVRLIYANPIAVVGGFSADRQVLPSWLVIQGKLELAASRVQNGDLTPPQSDARTLVKPELQLEAQLTPSDHVEGRLVLELAHGFELEDDLNKKKPERLVFGVREANT